MADERTTDPYTFVMDNMSNDCKKINNFWNLKRKEGKFLTHNYIKDTISYEQNFQIKRTCKFAIVIGYHIF